MELFQGVFVERRGQSLPGTLRFLWGYSAVLESYLYSFLGGVNSLGSVLAKSCMYMMLLSS